MPFPISIHVGVITYKDSKCKLKSLLFCDIHKTKLLM